MNIDFNIKEILTLPTTVIATLALASSILVFSSTTLLEQMIILDFGHEYGFIIVIVFIFSIGTLFVNLIHRTAVSIVNEKAKKNFYTKAESRLLNLNNYQKAIIYALSQEDKYTLPLPLHDEVVLELENNK